MDLATAARELYGLRPDAFTAARNEYVSRARADGSRELAAALKALRRPTTGAWVLNLLAREDREELEAVVELGGRLREAVGVLAADELRALDGQRRQLTRAVAARGAALAEAAGHRVAAAVVAEVEESLRAAMVDERAGRAVLTGVLLDAFSSTGLEPVDVDRILAVPDLVPGTASTPVPARRGEKPQTDDDAPRRVAARARLEEAARAAEEAAEAADRAEEAVRSAVRSRRDADRAVEDLRARLDAAEESARRARAEEDAARSARDAAEERRGRAAEARSRAAAAAERWLPGASLG